MLPSGYFDGRYIESSNSRSSSARLMSIWFSVSIAFITGSARWGGAFGIMSNDWLVGFMGSFGAGAVLAFALLLFLVLAFDVDFDFSVDLKKPSFKKFGGFKAALAGVGVKAGKVSFADNETEVKDWERQIKKENKKLEIENPVVDGSQYRGGQSGEFILHLSLNSQLFSTRR